MKRLLVLSCLALLPASSRAAQSRPTVPVHTKAKAASPQPTTASAQSEASASRDIVTISAGTHVFVTLESPLHTTSARASAGVYLETLFPMVENDRVVIPAETQVEGFVQAEQRPGRVKGRAQLRFHFTTLIYPNNQTVSIDGGLISLLGSSKHRAGEDGTPEPVDQIDRDVYTIGGGLGWGTAIGVIADGAKGGAIGAGIGGGLAIAKALFTRGDEIHLPVGTKVEMVLQQPVTIGAARLK